MVERYFVSGTPVAMELLNWLRNNNMETASAAKFAELAAPYLTMGQCQAFSREVWGFLSGCVYRRAETHFKRITVLNGLDAWRRIVRIIKETVGIRWGELRWQVQMVHTKPIKDLECIPVGIAEPDYKFEEYEVARGTVDESGQVRTSDLFFILPCSL